MTGKALNVSNLVDEMAHIVGIDNLVYRAEDLIVYESDATSERVLPAIVALPASAEEVEAVVKLARRHNLPVIPRGAGTGLSGGAVSDAAGVLIGTARMKRLLEMDVQNHFAIVEPGMVNADLSIAAEPHGLYYAPDPSSQRACTIGGNVSENSGGPHCLLYGMTTNHILGLEIVTAEGDRCWIGGPGPDRAGYDLVGALVGSEGTLAVVTKVMVRLLHIPPATRTLLGIFESMDDASASVSAVIAAGMIPAALEMMDQVVIRAVEPARQHPAKMWTLAGDLLEPLLPQPENETPLHSRQYQALPKVFAQNSSLELAWSRVLDDPVPTISGRRVAPFFTEGAEGFSIDYPEDLERAEALLARGEASLPEARARSGR